MWFSEVLLVVNPRNADQNTATDIAAALLSVGATDIEVDDSCSTVSATLPTADLSLLQHIAGVSYVRPVHNYYSAERATA
jgi:hypothetical protein